LTSLAHSFNLRAPFNMKLSAAVQPLRAISAATLLLLAAAGSVPAQGTNSIVPPLPEAASEVEQLRALNIRLQAQLREAELAIERNRAEAQEAARAQAAAITEKLTAIQTALDAERKRQQEELSQQRDELSRQRDQLQKSNTTLAWVAGGFGAFGVFAMLYTALFQWRMTNRIAEVTAIRAQLPAPAEHGLATTDAGMPSKTVELSNQRLMTVIERLERRVFELENTAVKPLPAGESQETTTEASGTNGRIAVLFSKGQALLEAEKPSEAVSCYDEILDLQANHPEALVKKGAALERLKKDEEALRCYDQAIAADGTLTIAYLYKGGIYNRLERYNEALECYEQALRAQGGTA